MDSNTNYVTLRELGDSKRVKIRAAVARHPRLQHYKMIEMCSDKIDDVRASLASNPNLPKEAWEILSKDSSSLVRETLKQYNPDIPEVIDARKSQ